jgi:hypothetical protein
LLDRVVLEAEAVAEEQLIVLLRSVVIEELLVDREVGALKAPKGEGLVRVEVPFYLGGDRVIENVYDWEENWYRLDLGQDMC